MAMDLSEIESLIKEALPDAKVEIQDLAGDVEHDARHGGEDWVRNGEL